MNGNDIDRRLQEAAGEVREIASRRRVPTAPTSSPVLTRGWLVFAAAFVAVVIVGIVPLLGNRGEVQPGDGTGPTTELVTPTTTTIPSTSTTSLVETCSATGVELPVPAEGLPPAVADTRDALIEAASSCSLAQLVDIAGDDLRTSFGDDAGVQNLVMWEDDGNGELDTLLKLLDMSYAVMELEGQPSIYVWPAAFAHDFWNDIPADQLEELLALYTEAELEEMAFFGSYAGWRIGIDEDGRWLFFIAGD